eukprot:3068955-Prymnesium_polylepis.1
MCGISLPKLSTVIGSPWGALAPHGPLISTSVPKSYSNPTPPVSCLTSALKNIMAINQQYNTTLVKNLTTNMPKTTKATCKGKECITFDGDTYTKKQLINRIVSFETSLNNSRLS